MPCRYDVRCLYNVFVWVQQALWIEHLFHLSHQLDRGVAFRVSDIRRFHHAKTVLGRDGTVILGCEVKLVRSTMRRNLDETTLTNDFVDMWLDDFLHLVGILVCNNVDVQVAYDAIS